MFIGDGVAGCWSCCWQVVGVTVGCFVEVTVGNVVAESMYISAVIRGA